MNNLTRKGIAKDLKISPYFYSLSYDDVELTFMFSSKLNLKRFEERFIDYRIFISRSLTQRFKVNISMNILSDIILYRKIEHRGFTIKKDGEFITWLNNIKLDGVIKILENYQE